MLRSPVVGQEISLGSRSELGIHAASVLYSLVETANLCGLGPRDYRDYLRTALDAALDDVVIPLPHELA